MKDCEHEVKIKLNNIVSFIHIYERRFECTKCNKVVHLRVNRFLTILALIVFITFSNLLIINPLVDMLSNETLIIRYGVTILAIMGLVIFYSWIMNFIIWLLRKKIKFVEVEDYEQE